MLVPCLYAQGIATLLNPLLNEIGANMLKRKSLARACLIAHRHSSFPPEGVHFLGEIRINARASTSIVMTRCKTVSERMSSSLSKTNAYRAVVLGYDALKILYTVENVVLIAGTTT